MKQLRMIHRLESIPEYTLAEGFRMRAYRAGDEAAWVQICKHGLLKQEEGLEAWDSRILSIADIRPEEDVIFVCDVDNEPVATITAFVDADGIGRVHMVAAKPEIKGNQIGSSMAALALQKLNREVPKCDIRMARLTTDDWRLPAIVGYLRAGFQPVLFDENMDTRWQEVCNRLNLHGITMLDDDGIPTDVVL